MKFEYFFYINKLLFNKKQSKKQPLFSNSNINILHLLKFALILIILFIIYPFFKHLIILNNKKLLDNRIDSILNNINKNIILSRKGILFDGIPNSISNPLIIVSINDYVKELSNIF